MNRQREKEIKKKEMKMRQSIFIKPKPKQFICSKFKKLIKKTKKFYKKYILRETNNNDIIKVALS